MDFTYYRYNTPATLFLIVINIIVFFAVRSGKTGYRQLGSSYEMTIYNRQYHRIITSAFTHEEPMHIICNMYSLFNLGTVLEPVLGTTRFVTFYAVIMILGGALSCFIHKKYKPLTLSIGASGVLCGLLGIYTVMIVAIYGLSGIRSVLPTMGILLLMTTSKRIDSVGHFSGLAVGILCGIVLLNM